MASVSIVLFPILFADDTNVFLSGNIVDQNYEQWAYWNCWLVRLH